MVSVPPSSPPQDPPSRPYIPRHTSFPYTPVDFRREDETVDTDFYRSPRFVTHIDDNAIGLLRDYYSRHLPRTGRILDLCSSWVSHFPEELEQLAVETKNQSSKESSEQAVIRENPKLEVIGQGMNAAELSANPILYSSILQNLNTAPDLPKRLAPLDATTCVVSIDYLTQPVRVLASIFEHTRPGGSIHLVVSNRCFPTKAVGRWLRISEEERLQMVGDYLWFAGWRNIEIYTLNDGKTDLSASSGIMAWFGGRTDPLWVVRASKSSASDT